jgi:hypothetical protein
VIKLCDFSSAIASISSVNLLVSDVTPFPPI